MPFVWRTRTLFWTSFGAVVTFGAAAYGRAMDVQPMELPGLDEMTSWLGYATFLLYGLIFVIVVDTVRRTRPIVRHGHHLLVFACVAMSTLAVSLPLTVFVPSLAPRVARLESESTIAMHAKNRFWRCWSDKVALEAAIGKHITELENVFLKYDRSAADAPRFIDRSGAYLPRFRLIDEPYPAKIPPICRARFPAEADAGFVVPVGFTYAGGTLDSVGEKLLHVDAAQRYVIGDYSGYEDLRAPTATIMSLIAAAAATAFSSAYASDVRGFITHGSSVSIVSSSTPLSVPVNSPRVWSLRLPFWRRRRHPLDRRLAVSSPVLWSSRVHAAAGYLLIPPAIIALVAVSEPWNYARTAVFVLFFVLALRSQEAARYAPLSWRGEYGVFLIHVVAIAVALVVVWVAVPALLDPSISTLRDNFTANVVGITLGSLFMASAMQAARIGPSAGVIGSIVSFGLFALGTIPIFEWMGMDGRSDPAFAAAIVAFTVSAMLVVAALVRFEARRSFRRLALGALMVVTSGPMFIVLLVMPTTSDIPLLGALLAATLGLAGVALALYTTRNVRRALAYTVR